MTQSIVTRELTLDFLCCDDIDCNKGTNRGASLL